MKRQSSPAEGPSSKKVKATDSDDIYGNHGDPKLYFKLLVSQDVAGAIIGRRGQMMDQICEEARCRLDMSNRNFGVYPQTDERVLIVTTFKEVAFLNCLEVMLPFFDVEKGGTVKLRGLLSKQASARIIGKNGNSIKELRKTIEHFSIDRGANEHESIFTVEGPGADVMALVGNLCKRVFEDAGQSWYGDWGSKYIGMTSGTEAPRRPSSGSVRCSRANSADSSSVTKSRSCGSTRPSSQWDASENSSPKTLELCNDLDALQPNIVRDICEISFTISREDGAFLLQHADAFKKIKKSAGLVKIEMSEPRDIATIRIHGPCPNIYLGHAMILHKIFSR